MNDVGGSDMSSDCDDDYFDDSIHMDDDDDIPSVAFVDPEAVSFKCLLSTDAFVIIDQQVKQLARELSLHEDEALYIMQRFNFNHDSIINAARDQGVAFFDECLIRVNTPAKVNKKSMNLDKDGNALCEICFCYESKFARLGCDHKYCINCWKAYIDSMLNKGLSAKMECMNSKCKVQCLRDFICEVLADMPTLIIKYLDKLSRDSILSHPFLRYCPGTDCPAVIYCESDKPRQITCQYCHTSFCVQCGFDYHAPASCDVMTKWRKKCGDDSETANYIRAHTKDCPKCSACIEKNGGCNHMQCSRCDHHFCWMCFKDWKTHGSEYYECSRYKENPAVAQEAKYLKARHNLEKYLHYFERFDNHNKSLKLEEELRTKLKQKINEKVAQHEGTWIDWQYLHDAASLLTKCRYTLQYTYPFAYYLESGQRKELFEYQQAQLEKEIEELSWKVERAESTDRADLEEQMHVAECKRRTLLTDFLT